MCGRFFIADDHREEELQEIIDTLQRKNGKEIQTGVIYPTSVVPVIANSRAMEQKPFLMKWGYSMEDGKLVINTRSETAEERMLFADGMKQRRCLIPASYYYEWERRSTQKTKYEIKPVRAGVMYMAGIYRMEKKQPVFTILTKEPAQSIAFIHDRMPVILDKEMISDWLNTRYAASDILRNAVNNVHYHAVTPVQQSMMI